MEKNVPFFIRFLVAVVFAISTVIPITMEASVMMEKDSVTMGPGYAFDIFYSLEDGQTGFAPGDNWDISFYVGAFTSTISTNGGRGVDLYTYPNGDTSAWTTLDTAGLSGWPAMHNSEEWWDFGAFNQNALGHPDYGWGVYNDVTHNLFGDSLFVIQLVDGSYKKLWIIDKYSMQSTYHFKFANLDGSDEVTVELNTSDYDTKNFLYYSISDQQVVDREPAKDTWDFQFTKYVTWHPMGQWVIVTGVLSNNYVYSNEFDFIDPEFMDWLSEPLDSTISAIGWDWKTFDFGSVSYVTDSVTFFVHDLDMSIYRLVFTSFEGSTTGKIVFNKDLISYSELPEPVEATGIVLAPNPASDYLNVMIGHGFNSHIDVSIFDITGRRVLQQKAELAGGGQLKLSLSELEHGAYIVIVNDGSSIKTEKLIVN